MSQRRHYPDAFKKDAVRRLLARGPKTISQVAKELGVSTSMLHRWRERSGSELGGLSQPNEDEGEGEEIERLRRELREAQAENALLRKCAALFAKDVK